MTVSSHSSDWPYREACETVQAGGVSWRVLRGRSGPAVLPIHGTAASIHSFPALAGALAADFRVIMADLPDHGFSGVLEAPTLPRVADELRALIDRLCVSPALVGRHSAGATIGLRIALDGLVPGAQVVGDCAALKPYGGAADGLPSQAARPAFLSAFASRLFAFAACRHRVTRLIVKTGSHLDADGIDCYALLLRREEHVKGALRMMARWNLSPLLKDSSDRRRTLRLRRIP